MLIPRDVIAHRNRCQNIGMGVIRHCVQAYERHTQQGYSVFHEPYAASPEAHRLRRLSMGGWVCQGPARQVLSAPKLDEVGGLHHRYVRQAA